MVLHELAAHGENDVRLGVGQHGHEHGGGGVVAGVEPVGLMGVDGGVQGGPQVGHGGTVAGVGRGWGGGGLGGGCYEEAYRRIPRRAEDLAEWERVQSWGDGEVDPGAGLR